MDSALSWSSSPATESSSAELLAGSMAWAGSANASASGGPVFSCEGSPSARPARGSPSWRAPTGPESWVLTSSLSDGVSRTKALTMPTVANTPRRTARRRKCFDLMTEKSTQIGHHLREIPH